VRLTGCETDNTEADKMRSRNMTVAGKTANERKNYRER